MRLRRGRRGIGLRRFRPVSRNDFVRRMLVKFDYGTLGRADKVLAKRFLAKATELSRRS